MALTIDRREFLGKVGRSAGFFTIMSLTGCTSTVLTASMRSDQHLTWERDNARTSAKLVSELKALNERWKTVLAIDNGKTQGERLVALASAKSKTIEVIDRLERVDFNEKLSRRLLSGQDLRQTPAKQRKFIQVRVCALNFAQREYIESRLRKRFNSRAVLNRLNHTGGIPKHLERILSRLDRDHHNESPVLAVESDNPECNLAAIGCLALIAGGLYLTSQTGDDFYVGASILICGVAGAGLCL